MASRHTRPVPGPRLSLDLGSIEPISSAFGPFDTPGSGGRTSFNNAPQRDSLATYRIFEATARSRTRTSGPQDLHTIYSACSKDGGSNAVRRDGERDTSGGGGQDADQVSLRSQSSLRPPPRRHNSRAQISSDAEVAELRSSFQPRDQAAIPHDVDPREASRESSPDTKVAAAPYVARSVAMPAYPHSPTSPGTVYGQGYTIHTSPDWTAVSEVPLASLSTRARELHDRGAEGTEDLGNPVRSQLEQYRWSGGLPIPSQQRGDGESPRTARPPQTWSHSPRTREPLPWSPTTPLASTATTGPHHPAPSSQLPPPSCRGSRLSPHGRLRSAWSSSTSLSMSNPNSPTSGPASRSHSSSHSPASSPVSGCSSRASSRAAQSRRRRRRVNRTATGIVGDLLSPTSVGDESPLGPRSPRSPRRRSKRTRRHSADHRVAIKSAPVSPAVDSTRRSPKSSPTTARAANAGEKWASRQGPLELQQSLSLRKLHAVRASGADSPLELDEAEQRGFRTPYASPTTYDVTDAPRSLHTAAATNSSREASRSSGGVTGTPSLNFSVEASSERGRRAEVGEQKTMGRSLNSSCSSGVLREAVQNANAWLSLYDDDDV